MRWLSRLVVVLVVCFLAIVPSISPAQGQDASIDLSPSSGMPGEEVTVYGHNFTPSKYVDIYYYRTSGDDIWVADVKTEIDGDFAVSFIVPESYKGDHTVRAEEDSTAAYVAEAPFSVEPGLMLDPDEGPVGSNVAVEGQGFAEDEQAIEVLYYLDGDYQVVAENIEADGDGSWGVNFTVPPSARGSHRVTAMGAESRLSEVQDATFRVASGITIIDPVSGSPIDDPSGSPGQSITMTGRGFAAGDRDITILFDGEETNTDPDIIRADDTGRWRATFEVPERSKGTYSVTAEGESTPKEDIAALSFKVGPGLLLSPDEGHAGTELTVTGGGFASNKDIVVKYDGMQIATAETGARGSFEVGFDVPESEHGQREVTAEDTAGNNATAVFTMESDPPDRPDLISPDDGDRAGFIGRVRPTFKWSAVSDDSGVRYNLQIARGNSVTGSGFADPVVSVTGIVGTNYTLSKAEALTYGNYYWIVQAVDGADNKSGWTTARSFHAGRLPLWAFVLIIVAIVAGIGTAVYFFVIRRRIYYL